MLSIRLQRLGRKGYPVYRVVVQDNRQSPDSGKYIALLGNYNPHTKAINLDKEKAELFLKNGAQPSDRIVSLFKNENISLPSWVKEPSKQEKKLKNPDKLRKNRPAEPEAPAEEPAATEEAAPEPAAEQAENPAEAAEPEAPAPETEAESSTEEEKPADASEETPSEPAAEAPAENKE